MKDFIGNDRGIALVIVILLVAVIVAVTIQLNRATRTEVTDAANLRDGVTLLYIAKSGYNGGTAFLRQDTNEYDSLTEDWARSSLLSASSSVLFDEGYFILLIEDESRKIPINRLVSANEYNPLIEDLLMRFLMLPEFELTQQDAGDIMDAVKDWIDDDDEVTGFGAEDLYYRSLDDAYTCKNGPLDCVDELLMVKGVSPELLYGTTEKPGIAPYLTVHGNGKININTAEPRVLQVLSPDITEEMASDMDAYRKDKENALSQTTWYKNVTGMDAIVIEGMLISTQSDVFRIISTGYLGDMRKTVTGVVDRDRDKKTVKLLSWAVE
ncbi:MAG: type II secretion system minor pseudopilin GspK [Deltaproteobacteria bacterium]|nr:type II secretion system minor pseudopilin GspK [Deltaproteobacteria bacterium]